MYKVIIELYKYKFEICKMCGNVVKDEFNHYWNDDGYCDLHLWVHLKSYLSNVHLGSVHQSYFESFEH